jgi:hypothetical protein
MGTPDLHGDDPYVRILLLSLSAHSLYAIDYVITVG